VQIREDFFENFNRQLIHDAQCYEQGAIKCVKYKKGGKRFKKDRGMRWKKICFNRKTLFSTVIIEAFHGHYPYIIV